MRWIVVVGTLLLVTAVSAAGRWTRAYIRALPEDAFAAVEVRPDGRPVRHLPHHDAAGCVDGPHLRSALARLGQVRWLDPAEAERARRHLAEHARAFYATPPRNGAGRVACLESAPRSGDESPTSRR